MRTITTEELDALIEQKRYAAIKQALSQEYAVDLAQLLEEQPYERIVPLFRLLPKGLAADTFLEMGTDLQERLILGFSDSEMRALVGEMYVDDTVDLIEEMPAGVVKKIIASADPAMRNDINEILKYPKDSAGSVMTTEYIALRAAMTLSEAFDKIRRVGTDSETIYTCYVTVPGRKLVGVVTVKDLLLAKQDATVGELMETNLIVAHTDENKEEVSNRIREYGLMALPVVDKDGLLVGIVTVDDAFDIISEESEEDFSKMAATAPTETTYTKTSVFTLFKARFPWLLLLTLSATFTGAIISSFEEKLAACAVLIGFIPMLMNSGGNSGAQASVAVIRGLSLGDLVPKDALRVLLKEIAVGGICGVLLALCNALKMLLVDRLLFANPDVTVWVILVVSLTLALTVLMAKAVGCLLPFLAKLVRLDPAVMAAPVISTLVDAMSLLIYFGFAVSFLHL
ncbi:MAG: magnesium transporter [Clostridia bacterium]|nr:magnesium transporter [Clostridia bacterium]MBQ8399141.1 magnesium transporter [Clostridia bacterium]